LEDKGSRGDDRWSEASDRLRAIAHDAVRACHAADAIERFCRIQRGRLVVGERAVSLRGTGRLVLIAFGKAAPEMLDGVKRAIGETAVRRPLKSMMIAPRASNRKPDAVSRRWNTSRITGGHPLPSPGSYRAGREALRLASGLRANDDVIFLASGGGSALMAAPLAPFLGTREKTELHRYLVVSGAPIGAINAVRRHLSAIKGGRLAAAARRAKTQTTLVLCDVDPERFDEVASGPTLPDPTTLDDMIAVVDRHGLPTLLPDGVLAGLRSGALPETPKRGDAIFRRARAHLVLSNRDLRDAAVRHGMGQGLATEAMPRDLPGPVEEGVELVARAIEGAPPGTRLLVMGGEVVTSPSGGGRGGRAQELALRLALRMKGLSMRPWAFLAIGSDGVDGNSPAAGALADWTTLERARRARIDPSARLDAADSHRFFKKLGDTIVMPPTGTNVRDLYLLLTGEIAGARRGVRLAARDREPSSAGSES
jgi:glycerate-2-kinase